MQLDDAIDPNVFLLKLIPGTRPEIFDQIGKLGFKGVVIEGFGMGGIHCLRRNLLEGIKKLIKDDVAVLLTTQCLYEPSDLMVYEPSRQAVFSGILQGFDMTSESAVTKLMWVLANEKGAEVRAQLQQDQRGEQSYVRHEVRFEPAEEERELWELNARAAGAVSRRGLEAAMLRLQVEGVDHLQVELNERRILQLTQAQGGSVTDVTDGVRRYMVDDRPFHLRIRAEQPFRLRQAELLLTARS